MKLAGDYLFDASVQDVWDALFDPEVLAAAMPGCEKLDVVDGDFVGEMRIKIGPISGKFSGKVHLEDKDEPKRYKMVVDGRGAPGFVKATATIALAPEGAATRLTYDADAQIGGKIASVGERLVDASARAITKQSLDGLHENIKIRAAHQAKATPEHAPSATSSTTTGASAGSSTTAPTDSSTTSSTDSSTTSSTAPTTGASTGSSTTAPTDSSTTAPTSSSTTSTAPRPVYMRADAGQMAKAVAAATFKTMLPVIVAIAVGVAIVVWLIIR